MNAEHKAYRQTERKVLDLNKVTSSCELPARREIGNTLCTLDVTHYTLTAGNCRAVNMRTTQNKPLSVLRARGVPWRWPNCEDMSVHLLIFKQNEVNHF